MKEFASFFLFLLSIGGKQQVCSQAISRLLIDKLRIPTTNEILKGSVKSVDEICYVITEDTSVKPIIVKKYEYKRGSYEFSNNGHLTRWKQYSWGKLELMFTSKDVNYSKIDSVKGSLREERSVFKKKGNDTEVTTQVYLNGSLYSTIFRQFNLSQQLVYLKEEEAVYDLGIYECFFTYKDGLLSEEITCFDGNFWGSTYNFYSKDGLLDSCYIYDEKGLDRRITYKYNSQKNEIKKEFSAGRRMGAATAVYSNLDKFGNWTKMTSPAGIDSYYLHERKIIYY